MEVFWLLQMVVILLLPSGVYAYRHRHHREQALKGAALILAGWYTLVFGVLIAGETAFEVGAWPAVGLTAAWLVPLLVLSLVAWYRPEPAAWVLTGLLVLAGAVYLWSAFASAAWEGFEEVQGPVRGVISFALVAPLALLAWRRPALGGSLLLVLAALPVAVIVIGLLTTGVPEGWPLLVVSVPAAVTGLLYLGVATLHHRPSRHRPTRHRPMPLRA